MALDERLKHELERVGRPADPSGIYEGLIRRRERRRILRKVEVGALGMLVVLGSLGGFYALTQVFGDAEAPVVTDGELGPACDVTRVTGVFFPRGETGTAYVFEPEPEGGCDGPNENFQHIAIVGADGRVVATSEELTAGTDVFGSRVVAAPDIDGDGIAELAIDVSDPETPAMGIDFYRVRIDPETQEPVGFVHLAPRCEDEGCVTPQLEGIGTLTWGVTERAFSGIDCGGGSFVAWTEPADRTRTGTYIVWEVHQNGLVERSDILLDYEPHTEPPRDMCGAPVSQPITAPSPTASPAPQEGEDIGLPFRVCFAERLGGIDFLGDGSHGNAWTAVPLKDDGTCRGVPERYIVAADHTGDGAADSWTDLPFGCYVGCAPSAATDLDANGTEELIVAHFFSIMDFTFFAIAPDAEGNPAVEPILVAEPGHEPATIVAGEPLRIDAWGDAGYGSTIQCEGYPEDPVIVWSWSDGPIEGNQPREIHIARLELRDDGLFHVVGTNDFAVPNGEPTGLGYQGDLGRQCGVGWGR